LAGIGVDVNVAITKRKGRRSITKFSCFFFGVPFFLSLIFGFSSLGGHDELFAGNLPPDLEKKSDSICSDLFVIL